MRPRLAGPGLPGDPKHGFTLVELLVVIAIIGENPCKRAWGSFHPNGLNFVYCDGSVRFISTNIDMEMFARMATISGGDIIQLQ